MVADWSPTAVFFTTTALLQIALAVVLYAKARKDETSWLLGTIFGINGCIAAARAISTLYPDVSALTYAQHRTVWPFDIVTNFLILYLALVYPRPTKWVGNHRVAARVIIGSICAAFAIPVILFEQLQPQYGGVQNIWAAIHVSVFQILGALAFPLLLLRWGLLLPKTTNPTQLHHFKFVFAAFGMRAAHMIGTWETISLQRMFTPTFWLGGQGLHHVVTVSAAVAALVAVVTLVGVLIHMAMLRRRTAPETARAIGFVLIFMAAGLTEAFADRLALYPLWGSGLRLANHPFSQLDILVIRPVLIWIAIVRHRFVEAAVPGVAGVQAIAFALAVPAFYGGLLPTFSVTEASSGGIILVTAGLSIGMAGFVAVLSRPLADMTPGGTKRQPLAAAEADYMAALEDIYRRGAEASDEREHLDRIRRIRGLSRTRADTLEQMMSHFWSNVEGMTRWGIGDRVLGRYMIEEYLGAGGMGHAYRCIDELRNQPVVLKRSKELNQDSLAAIHHEARILSNLNHPNIVRLQTTAHSRGESILVMDFYGGGSLEDRLREGALPPRQVVMYAQDLLSALAAAHSKSIVHRDIKPANILLDDMGICHLVDFGISSHNPEANTLMTMTMTTARVQGTIRYAAPEVLAGGLGDERSDLYSLGLVLRDCLVGDAGERTGAPDPDALEAVPMSMRNLMHGLLQPNPDNRPPSARAAMALLD